MGKAFTEAKHLVRFETVLGENAFILETLTGGDKMSRGFGYVVTAFSTTLHNVKPNELLGTTTTLSIVQSDSSMRYINGYITDFKALGSVRAGERARYQFKIKSWVQLHLPHRTDCRIFQDVPVTDVIQKILEPYSRDGSFQFRLMKPHKSRPYWVQYNETDLNFLHRICALENMGYYFEHSNGAHNLVFFDTTDRLMSLTPDQITVQSGTAAHDHLSNWHAVGRFGEAKFERRSYNYKRPHNLVISKQEATEQIAIATKARDLESYEYAEYHNHESDAELRTEAATRSRTGRNQFAFGSGNCRFLEVGKMFQIKLPDGPESRGANYADKGKRFVIANAYLDINNTKGTIESSLECLPQHEFVLPNSRARTINGTQTAKVTGPKGAEVYTDKLGRVKVQFYWDREGKYDENTSCWMRVMQSFAGNTFGAHFTPRIGQEVVVSFENGNPDRPFVLGALYHGEHQPPYVKASGTRNGIRTRSLKEGNTKNYNELYFEDKKGQEEVYLQAEKDQNTWIKHNQTVKIDNDHQENVGHDSTTHVGNDIEVKAGNKIYVESGTEYKLQVGTNAIADIKNDKTVTAGNKILIDAGTELTLKVGGSTIVMTGDTITMSSKFVVIDGKKTSIN